MSASFPEIHLLTNDDNYNDYRPAIDRTGKVVVFERTEIGQDKTVLYKITDLTAPNPQPLLSNPSNPPSQTRPDWCWQTGLVAFNGASSDTAPVSVNVYTGAYGCEPVPNTTKFFYPTWNGDGSQLVTENTSTGASPRPCNSTFDTGGNVYDTNIDGIVMVEGTATAMYGGMPAAKPGEWPLIAFAGQPAIKNWGKKTDKIHYNEDFNYIFLNSSNGSTFTSQPMEPGAPLGGFNEGFQGRAPAWSPDGSTIAFESNRSGNDEYAIYLCDVDSGAITPVTDPTLGAQHAKFFPCGTKLVLCIRPKGVWHIAWVDISTLL